MITIENPDVAIKLTMAQAVSLGIQTYKDKMRAEIEYIGSWQIPKSYKALCINRHYKRSYGINSIEKTELIGIRKMSKLKQNGYHVDGYVSVNGKQVKGYSSAQMFEIDGNLIDVEVICI